MKDETFDNLSAEQANLEKVVEEAVAEEYPEANPDAYNDDRPADYLPSEAKGETSDPTSATAVANPSLSASSEAADAATQGALATNAFRMPNDGPSIAQGAFSGVSGPTTPQTTSGPGTGLAVRLRALMANSNTTPTVRGKLTPTDEQQAIIDLSYGIMTGKVTSDVAVFEAGAGTGKTATFRMLADILPGTGQYVTFTAALTKESQVKFHGTRVQCNTIHSLAFRAIGHKYSNRLNGPRIRSERVAQMLGIKVFSIKRTTVDEVSGENVTKPHNLAPGFLASQVMGAVKKFCMSADKEISTDHFKYIDGIDLPDAGGRRTYTCNNQVREYLLPFAQHAWEDICEVEGSLPFIHDHYVKMWELDKPTISANYILTDEAQDCSPVFLSVLEQQGNTPKFLVGDSAQEIYCQPEGTQVRVPVMDTSCCGRGLGGPTYSWKEVPIEDIRVGDKVVSYSRVYRLGSIRQKGCRVSEVTTRRFEGDLVRVQIGETLKSEYTPDHHCITMLGEIGVGKWVLYMQKLGHHYRVGACQGKHGSMFGPMMRAIQNKAEAVWILALFDDKESCLSAERHIHSSFPDRGFSDPWWESRPSNFSSASTILMNYGLRIDQPFVTRDFWLDKSRSPFVTTARNLISGMLMFPADNVVIKNRCLGVRKQHWKPISVSTRHFEGNVVSLGVEEDHTYVADGIVTHNSWRGAVNAMAAFPDAPRLFLSQSFRFGQAIADVANAVLETLEEATPLRLKGFNQINSTVAPMAEYKAVLCRTNAVAVGRLLAAIADGKAPFLVGGGADVIAFVKAAKELQMGLPTNHPELACFESWPGVQDYVKDEEGEDLKLLVNLIDAFGCDPIISALENMPAEKDADLIISTSHKSKGREWDSVKIERDFPTFSKSSDADRKLLYVAVTRAKLALDISECPFFSGQDALDLSDIIKPSDYIPMMPPTPSAPPTTGFTWSKDRDNGNWIVRGPGGADNTEVEVSRKDGSSAKVKLGPAKFNGDGWSLYTTRRY